MSLYWKCECGEEFEELGVKEPGNDLGWRKAVNHVRTHRKIGTPKKILGLFNAETGEMVFAGGMRPLAVKQGIIPGKPVNEKKDKIMSASEILEKHRKTESDERFKLIQGIFEMYFTQQKLLIEIIIRIQNQMCELQKELVKGFLSLH